MNEIKHIVEDGHGCHTCRRSFYSNGNKTCPTKHDNLIKINNEIICRYKEYHSPNGLKSNEKA